MKKAILACICICVALGAVACSSGPQLSDQNVALGKQVILLTDSYLNGEAAAEEVAPEVEALAGGAANEPASNQANQEMFETALFILSTDIYTASTMDFLGTDKTEINEKIVEYRDKVAALVGEPKR